ncbi:transporter substrate-binding domain-containing protein [Agromyces mangrovi Wang et al. 2018]|uniref:transporter substrate-binding domain-containing protein n=1 Tax=Agromyces mangrovi TaxID=1858653 RepID=UPI0025739B94|nr:transporter substrate-binding domain-containing protein [Agromyces mangrovi]BDZ65472.1 ABC transporter substrate-binding protein [Agromyces mangrovi]
MAFLPEGDEDPENRQGFDIDLARAIAERLGVEAVFEQQPYEQYLPSLATGRLDLVESAMQDLESRRETVDFVDYFRTGPQLFTMIDRTDLTTVEDLCGGSVVIDVGDVGYQDAVNAVSAERCAADEPIEIIPASSTADALIQLEQGRADATIRGAESVRYMAGELEPDTYALVDEPLSEIPVGIAVAKDNTELRDAVAAALQSLIDDGTYAEIGETWGLSDLLVDAVTINGGE